jgi:hypothetical protein
VRAEEHNVQRLSHQGGDHRRSLPKDYVSEVELREIGIDPAMIRAECPWIVEYVGNDGVRCWDASDIAAFVRRFEL